MRASARLIPAVLAACLASSCGFEGRRIESTKAAGNRVVRALEQFQRETGAWPGSLADLVPRHLAEIPRPAWGLREWLYVADGAGFLLQVNESEKTGDGNAHWLMYDSELGRWEMGD